MDQESNDNTPESMPRMLEKTRILSKKVSELEKDIRRFLYSKEDLEVRIKILETEHERMSDHMSEMERNIKKLELNHDDRKERWNMAVNFVVQLAWVSMAAFLLSKLGLQAPL